MSGIIEKERLERGEIRYLYQEAPKPKDEEKKVVPPVKPVNGKQPFDV